MTALNWHDEQRRNLPPKDETWRDRANCRGVDGSVMFPTRGENVKAAKEVCRSCVVRERCLEYALTPPLEMWGVFGGMSERERRRLRQKRRRGE